MTMEISYLYQNGLMDLIGHMVTIIIYFDDQIVSDTLLS